MEAKAGTYFDADGTWFRWQLFSEWIMGMVRAGLLPRLVLDSVRAEFLAYKNREAPFSEFVNRQIRAYQDHARLRGIRVADAKLVAEQVIRRKGKRVHVFTRELAAASRDLGYMCAVISGSPREVVEAFARVNGIGAWFGTEHPVRNGMYTGGKPKEWVADKGAAVRKLAKDNGLDLSASIAIGDTASDIGMFGAVRYPICFNPTIGLLTVARANRWPVVTEKKDAWLCYLPDEGGRLHEAGLAEILPPEIAENLGARLAAVRRG